MIGSAWKLNDQSFSGGSKELLSAILSDRLDLIYWSTDALQKFYQGTLEITAEMLRQELRTKRKGALARKLKSLEK